MRSRPVLLVMGSLTVAVAASGYLQAAGPRQQARTVTEQATTTAPSPQRALLDRYCVTCHNESLVHGEGPAPSALVSQLRATGLAFDTLDVATVGEEAEVWEKVVRKLRGGIMPPAGRPRPDESTVDELVSWLEIELDGTAAAQPNPGRTATLHRVNRAEYRNAIRDLLALEIDVADFLPADDSSYGFDNIGGVLRLSQSLLERYLAAARTISRLAVGSAPPAIASKTYRNAQDLQQHERVDGLSFGTRGGVLVRHFFPQDADYDIRIELSRARSAGQPQFEVTVDGEQAQLFTLAPQAGGQPNPYRRGSTFEIRVPVDAGPREIGVAFYKNPSVLVERVREPFENPRVSGNSGGPGGAMPFVSSVTITGPHDARGPGDTPSRQRIFLCRPTSPSEEAGCATTILSALARRAYRGPTLDEDVQVLLDFYDAGRADGGSFDDGIELALRRLLVSPEFLFRIEADPQDVPVNTPYRISDLALASRLSFFLWSSIPDEELLEVAERGTLQDPVELERQVRRMLTDRRSEALTTNFAGQWLQLRNLETTVRPGDPYSLAFDESLRQGFLRETELFCDSIMRENRSLIEMLTADYTFLNARVARHYGIPNVQGSHFRRVTLPEDSPRRGLLGHGSILTLTSHAIRTSPVLRGKWILNNVLGTPPPDPPPNVPALEDRKTQAKVATMRDRMSQHRANPVCAACHSMIDPAGFALEHFDAIGRYRVVDESFNTIDASGVLPDGTAFDGVAELRAALVRRPERFVTTVTEKLLTYALGRGLEYYDMPAVRKIVNAAARDEYRFQSIVLGIVNSYPFLNRRVEQPESVEASASRP